MRPASLRNWAGRRLYDAGMPIEQVARRMGSRSLDSVRHRHRAWTGGPAHEPRALQHLDPDPRGAVLAEPVRARPRDRRGRPPVGRPSANPPYVVLAYGVLARVAALGDPGRARPGRTAHLDRGPAADDRRASTGTASTCHRRDRDRRSGTTGGGCATTTWPPTTGSPCSAGCSHRSRRPSARPDRAAADPHGPGSFTHPDATRAVYGDGTLVRPLYRPPETVLLHNDDGTTTVAYPDPRTGQLLARPPGRFDPDLELHHGRGGPVLTHGYVCWHTRGPKPYQRIDLAAAHIPAPGAEAATAVALLRDVHRAAGAGIQVVVYDGALRGVHIEEIMRSYGYLVLAKQHTDATLDDPETARLVKTPGGRRAR